MTGGNTQINLVLFDWILFNQNGLYSPYFEGFWIETDCRLVPNRNRPYLKNWKSEKLENWFFIRFSPIAHLSCKFGHFWRIFFFSRRHTWKLRCVNKSRDLFQPITVAACENKSTSNCKPKGCIRHVYCTVKGSFVSTFKTSGYFF